VRAGGAGGFGRGGVGAAVVHDQDFVGGEARGERGFGLADGPADDGGLIRFAERVARRREEGERRERGAQLRRSCADSLTVMDRASLPSLPIKPSLNLPNTDPPKSVNCCDITY
jgi:hypothetical protein